MEPEKQEKATMKTCVILQLEKNLVEAMSKWNRQTMSWEYRVRKRKAG